MSDLEKEYAELAANINGKIAEAGKLLAEANKLADDAGVVFLTYNEWDTQNLSEEEKEKIQFVSENISFRPVLNALSAAGWQTSSLYC